MLKESLVIFSCLNNVGCDKTSSVYIYYTPEVKHVEEVIEHELIKHLNEKFIASISTIALTISNKQLNIKLTNDSTLNINGVDASSIKLTYNKIWEF